LAELAEEHHHKKEQDTLMFQMRETAMQRHRLNIILHMKFAICIEKRQVSPSHPATPMQHHRCCIMATC